MWALASVAAFLTSILGHALLRRVAPRTGSVSAFLLAGSLVGALLACELLRQVGATVETFAGLASYAFACELYIFLFSSISSSLSAAYLYHLRSGTLPPGYGSAMVERRLARMVSSGILEKTTAGYRATARGAKLLRAYRYCRGFFRRAAYVR